MIFYSKWSHLVMCSYHFLRRCCVPVAHDIGICSSPPYCMRFTSRQTVEYDKKCHAVYVYSSRGSLSSQCALHRHMDYHVFRKQLFASEPKSVLGLMDSSVVHLVNTKPKHLKKEARFYIRCWSLAQSLRSTRLVNARKKIIRMKKIKQN